ncbi:MAG: AAA family ATPase [Lachnospiraceae bacterium]|nr:AAA family ATPase [Lachnospiraceae bacterium]
MKTTVLTFANNKGGSGKSTTCSNVAYALATLSKTKNKKVLMIDGDMQMNLSLSFFGEDEVLGFNESEDNLYHALERGKDIEKCIRHTEFEGLDLIPSSMLMSNIEEVLYKNGGDRRVLEKLLKGLIKDSVYDYILIDAPPTLGLWVRNILQASNGVVIPVEASPWGLFGLANMIGYVEDSAKENKGLKVAGIVITKVDVRKNYFHQTEELLKSTGDIPVFKTHIRVDSSIEWAQDNSKPVGAYRKSSRSAGEFKDLAKEIDKIDF